MRRSSKEWIIDGKSVRLACKTDEQLKQLIADVKYSLSANLKLPTLHYDKYDVIKIISLHFKDLGLVYFKKLMDKLNKEKGQFTKQGFLYELLNDGVKFNWQSISKDAELMDYLRCFDELVKQSRADTLDIEAHLKENKTFIDIVDKLSPRMILKICYTKYYDLFVRYLENLCREYTNNLEVVYRTSILKDIFGRKYTMGDEVAYGEQTDISIINNLLNDIVNKEYHYQCQYFIKTNAQRMILGNDKWFLFYLRGTSLKRREFDFSDIKSNTLKKEFQLYLKENRFKFKTDFTSANSFMKLFIDSLNFISKNNTNIKNFADIEISDVVTLNDYVENDFATYKKEHVSVSTMANNNSIFRSVVDFLIEYADEPNKETKLYYPIPTHNPFYDLEFRNIDNMKKSTDVIPEEVMEQILMHINELRSDYQKVFEVFNDTGIRADEALLLQPDCINKETNEFWYVPHKVISARRRHSYGDRKMLIISDEVKALIQEQIEITAHLREKFNLPYIFINDCKSVSRAMPSRSGFVNAVNNIIKKYDIRDLDNKLWSFTCRQIRKTVAETMILNNASPFEVQYQMGHLHLSTTRKHYAEVEKKKLADMETDFFQKEFEVKIGKDNLEKFTEEERRALYVDFRLNYRDVELGKCTKHYSEQPCGKISGKISCANCPKCATGKKYLPKWIELRNSQKQLVDIMIEGYISENISNYELFIEYQREVYFLNLYDDIINKLTNE